MRALTLVATLLATLGALQLLPPPAAAQLAAAPSRSAFATCPIRLEDLEFGVYNELFGVPDTSVGEVELACPRVGPPPVALITLSQGLSGQFLDRIMTEGSSELHYNLYVDVTRLHIAGDGTGGTEPLAGGPSRLPGGPVTFRVYGSIPSRQKVPAGDYSDNIEVTVLTGAGATAQMAEFAIHATVVNSCTVSAVDMNFGTYSPAVAATASTKITLNCTKGAAVTVALDGGGSGKPQARVMTGPGSLGYQLYTDAALQSPIITTGAAFQLTSDEDNGQTVHYTVYGQVPANQSVPGGSYLDTVRVTVTY